MEQRLVAYGPTGIGSQRFRFHLLVAAAALAVCAGLAADARGDEYYADPRQHPVGNTVDGRHADGRDPNTGKVISRREYAWTGPRVIVRGNTTNSDRYHCLGADVPTKWLAVADDVQSQRRSFTSTSDAYGTWGSLLSRYRVTTTNWSSHDINIRVVSTCTDDRTGTIFPYVTGTFFDWLPQWLDRLVSHTLDEDLEWLIDKAFGWETPFAASVSSRTVAEARGAAARAKPVPARKPGNRFALHNGNNRIGLSFKHARSTRRPPAIYLATQPAGADCESRRMHTTAIDGDGSVVLDLVCRGVEKGNSALLTVRKPIHRSFRLQKGNGTVRLHLDKPPGNVEPLVFIKTHPSHAPCEARRHDLDLTRTSMDLEIDAHCGRVGRKATGRIYVGGLLAPAE